MYTRNIPLIFLSIFILLSVNGCASTHSHHNQSGHDSSKQENSDVSAARMTEHSEKGLYVVTLESSRQPVPVGKIHSWLVHIKKADGSILEKGKLTVNGGMPLHKHGFPTVPRVKQYLGNGNYKVEGVKFGMRGDWEMRFIIKTSDGRDRDRVVFKINPWLASQNL